MRALLKGHLLCGDAISKLHIARRCTPCTRPRANSYLAFVVVPRARVIHAWEKCLFKKSLRLRAVQPLPATAYSLLRSYTIICTADAPPRRQEFYMDVYAQRQHNYPAYVWYIRLPSNISAPASASDWLKFIRIGRVQASRIFTK